MHYTQDPAKKKLADEKRKQTNIRLYGAANGLGKDALEKYKQTCLENFGVENPQQCQTIKDKVKSTNLKKYGGGVLLAPVAQKKYRQTCLRNLGMENPQQSKQIQDKTKTTNLKKYGSTTPQGNISIQNKTKETFINRYGEDFGKIRYSIGENNNNGIHPMQLCERPHYTVSKGELNLAETIRNRFNVEVEQSNRTVLNGKEIDIWVPSKNLGIEYNGEYWHSEAVDCPHYDMRNKQLLAKNQGISLINIWESEWQNRPEQILNFLEARIGNPTKIFARKCEIDTLHHQAAKEFINSYHIQQIQAVKLAYGLYHNGELLSCMVFDKHHRNNKEWVLKRFCTKTGSLIVGGATKLLKNAIEDQQFSSLTTWSNNRWSEGNVYQKMGFNLKAEYDPDYAYWTGSTIRSKQSCQKKSIGAREGQTERDRTIELGFTRIWDCGKKAWTLNTN